MDFEAGKSDRLHEPEVWFVAFHRESSRWWARWLSFGRFRHVSAFGYVARAKSWLFFEVMSWRTSIRVVPVGDEMAVLGPIAGNCTVLRMPPVDRADIRTKLKPGFWCVPAVAHLLGLGGCALRPDALYRQCLAAGGEIIEEQHDEIPDRSEFEGATGPGAAEPG